MTLERVLIIEDVEEEAKYLANAFRRRIGRTKENEDPVVCASNLKDAMKLLAQGADFSVIVLDLSFRKELEEGVRVLRFLRALPQMRPTEKTIPVVVFTGRDIVKFCVLAMKAGAADYVLKGEVQGGRFEDDVIANLYYACENAVENARGLPRQRLNEWYLQNVADLQKRHPDQFLAVYPEGETISGALSLGGRCYQAYASSEAAIPAFLDYPKDLDGDIQLIWVSREGE